MYVCICNNVTDTEIRDAVYDGARSMTDLSEQLDVGTCCGKCKSCAKKVLREARSDIACATLAASIPVGISEPVIA